MRAALAKRTLAAAGLLECVTFSFMSSGAAAAFDGGDPSLLVLNPIASDLDRMRPTPVATLALAAGRNAARGLPDALLFEVGPGFAAGQQELIAGGVFAGHTDRHPLAPRQPYDAMAAKAVALDLLEALGVPLESLSVTADALGWYHPGRSGVLRQGPKLALATFGELHPRVLAALELAGPLAALEVFLDRIPEPKRRKRAPPELSPFQPVRRDFAFVVAAETAADTVLRAARGADRRLIAGASVFDVYQGDKVPAGRKSIGIEVVLQPQDRTLTDAEIDAAASKIVEAVTKKTGAVLR